MYKLLALEYKKFKNNAVIDLFGLMFLITMPTVIFIFKELQLPKQIIDTESIFTFPSIWEYLGYTTSWLVFFFLGFIILTSITSEVTYKTMRQNIICGMTRTDFFKSKLYAAIALSLLTTIMFTIIGLGIGIYHTEGWTWSMALQENLYAIPKSFIMSMGYLSFALMIGFVIRKSGIAIFTYLCYVIFIDPMLKWAANSVYSGSYINYFPLNTIEDLFPLPFYRLAENSPISGIDFNPLLSNSHAIIFSCLWIAIFIGVAYRSFMTRDI